MSIEIFKDVDEALAREVRRITFDNQRSVTRVVLQDTFDPFTGDLIQTNIEPSFYDSSADASNIQYPQFFIKLIKTREDRFTKRVIPEYGYTLSKSIKSSVKGYNIILSGADGGISAPGNTFTTSTFNIRNVIPNYLLRILTGNNTGTYIVSSVTPSNSGPHTITLSPNLAVSLPSFVYSPGARQVFFNSSIDLNTVAAGDQFQDSLGAIFNINSVDPSSNSIIIGGITTPNTSANSLIYRTGNVLENIDLSLVRYIVMDPSMPVVVGDNEGSQDNSTEIEAINAPIPIDCFYLIRIDSKERQSHIEILNRIWEEFNPPRTALPVVVRTKLSAEEPLTQDITTGGSSIVNVSDSSKYNIGDTVFILDDFNPTRDAEGNFTRPFTSIVVDKPSITTLQLADTVPDSYKLATHSKIVSNARFTLHMFHFVDHNTRDNEGAQYWVHEFTFWVQVWVDRYGLPKEIGAIDDIKTIIADMNGNILSEDP